MSTTPVYDTPVTDRSAMLRLLTEQTTKFGESGIDLIFPYLDSFEPQYRGYVFSDALVFVTAPQEGHPQPRTSIKVKIDSVWSYLEVSLNKSDFMVLEVGVDRAAKPRARISEDFARKLIDMRFVHVTPTPPPERSPWACVKDEVRSATAVLHLESELNGDGDGTIIRIKAQLLCVRDASNFKVNTKPPFVEKTKEPIVGLCFGPYRNYVLEDSHIKGCHRDPDGTVHLYLPASVMSEILTKHYRLPTT